MTGLTPYTDAMLDDIIHRAAAEPVKPHEVLRLAHAHRRVQGLLGQMVQAVAGVFNLNDQPAPMPEHLIELLMKCAEVITVPDTPRGILAGVPLCTICGATITKRWSYPNKPGEIVEESICANWHTARNLLNSSEVFPSV